MSVRHLASELSKQSHCDAFRTLETGSYISQAVLGQLLCHSRLDSVGNSCRVISRPVPAVQRPDPRAQERSFGDEIVQNILSDPTLVEVRL